MSYHLDSSNSNPLNQFQFQHIVHYLNMVEYKVAQQLKQKRFLISYIYEVNYNKNV